MRFVAGRPAWWPVAAWPTPMVWFLVGAVGAGPWIFGAYVTYALWVLARFGVVIDFVAPRP